MTTEQATAAAIAARKADGLPDSEVLLAGPLNEVDWQVDFSDGVSYSSFTRFSGVLWGNCDDAYFASLAWSD